MVKRQKLGRWTDAYDSLRQQLDEIGVKLDGIDIRINRLAKAIGKLSQPERDPLALPPPLDYASERAVLACLLLKPELWARASEQLNEADFGDDRMRAVYGAMTWLAANGKLISDLTLLVGELSDARIEGMSNRDWAGVMSYLFKLFPVVSSFDLYVSRLKEMSRRRHDVEGALETLRTET